MPENATIAAMADEEQGGRPHGEPDHPRASRGLRAIFRRLRRRGDHDHHRRGEPQEPPTPEGAVDIVDQAQAFKSLRVDDVMTPRADIVAVEISSAFEDLLARFLEAEHTRMPIYRETLDDPVGRCT